MCGIAGTYFQNRLSDAKDEDSVRKATGILSHRGPDHRGYKTLGSAAFGHARLSIIDTDARSHQPMSDSTGRYLITYNGEIFNYQSLRRSLELEGYKFATESDTEVVINAYAHYGKSCLDEFNGFFSFAIYDHVKNCFFAARDRMGIKPLYFSINENSIAFTSELTAIRPLVNDWSINLRALHLYFQLTYIPAPHSIINGVEKLLPGHYIEMTPDHFEKRPYFELSGEPETINSFSACAQEVKEHLGRSVELRMVADVPLGTFLSGGIDSSIISHLAAKHHPNLETFALGFSDAPYLDESDAAERVAKAIGSKHHRIMVNRTDLYENVHEMLGHLDEPFSDSSALAVYVLSKYTSKHVKVALSGDGADELFGGYRKHRALLRSEQNSLSNRFLRNSSKFLSKLPSGRSSSKGDLVRKLTKYSAGINYPLDERYWRWLEWTSAEQVGDLLLNPQRDKQFEHSIRKLIDSKNLNSILLADLQILLPGDMLTKVDRMSMAHGLEVRTPFLDHRLVQAVSAMPMKFKSDSNTGKLLLREAFGKEIPTFVFNRPKSGFEIPIEDWMRNELSEEILSTANKQLLDRQGVFKRTALMNMIHLFMYKGRNELAPAVWSFFTFQVWWIHHFDQSDSNRGEISFNLRS